MYVSKKETVSQVNFLKSAHFISFTTQVEATGVSADGKGRKIVKAGTILPTNGATAKGILLTDVDVTEGPQPGALMVEGYVLQDRLPVAPTDEAKTALKEIKFY